MSTTISSKLTVFHKRVFPMIWFGILVLFTAAVMTDDEAKSNPIFFAAPLLMTVVMVVLLKFLVWDLVDEVEDHGDYLVVRNRDEQERIPLSNIINVSASTMVNPPRVTLRLVTPGKFGSEVAFTPVMRFSLNPFAKHPVVDDLIVRVDRARAGRRG